MTDRLTLTRRAALGSAVAVGLAACAPPKSESGGGSGGSGGKDSVNVFLYQKPNGVFCPIAPGSGPDGQVMSLIFEALLVGNAKGELLPQIAEKAPEISEDASTFTFHLRKGLTWSDGQPLTSKDVVYTYTRAADEKAGAGAGIYAAVEGYKEFNSGKAKTISGFQAPDDTTFIMKTTGPNAGLLGQIATLAIMPEHATKDFASEKFLTESYWLAPKVCSGPFTFVEYKTDQYVKMVRNDKYREPAKLKTVFLKPMTSDVATSQLGTGEMDIAPISPTDSDSVTNLDTVNITDVPSNGFVRACWNQTQERFKDPKVRQAFLYAVDREGIVKSALKGKGKVRYCDFDPAQTPKDVNTYAYNPEKAKQLLKEANFDTSKPVKLSWVAGGNPDRDQAATVIQDQLKQVGVNLQLDQAQPSAAVDVYKERSYDMTIFGGGDYKSEPFNVYNIVASDRWNPAGGNNGYYSNPKLDDVLKKANASADKAERQKLYEEGARLENADPSLMWLYTPDTVWAVNKKLKGFEGLSVDRGFINANKWQFSS